MLDEAQNLWRGPAYSEVRDEPFARAEARRLEEMLLAAIELRLDAAFTLGRHEALIGELETLTSQHPMRERLWSQRMLALYRSGRQAEALRSSRTSGRPWWTSSASSRGMTCRGWNTPSCRRTPHCPSWRPTSRSGRRRSGDLAGAAPASERVPRPHPDVTDPGTAGRAEPGVVRCCSDWWGRWAGATATCFSSKATRASARPASSANWPAPSRSRARWSCGAAATKNRWHPSSPLPRRSAGTSTPCRPTGSRGMPNWQLAELSRLVLRLREYAAPFDGDPGDPESNRYRFFEAVDRDTRRTVGERTLLLVVDDLHFADQPTLLLLRHVLRNIDRAKAGIVGMYIDTEVPSGHRVRQALADLRSDRSVETVHLEGLNEDGVEEFVRSWPKVPLDLVPQLFKLTDGNPLFLEEMLDHVGEQEAEQAAATATRPCPRTSNHPRRSGSWWPGASRGCPRT